MSGLRVLLALGSMGKVWEGVGIAAFISGRAISQVGASGVAESNFSFLYCLLSSQTIARYFHIVPRVNALRRTPGRKLSPLSVVLAAGKVS